MARAFVRFGFLFLALASCAAVCNAAPQPFTVADEIGLAHFGDPYTGKAEALQFSPDGKYFAALTERGRLDVNRPEDSLHIYKSEDVRGFLRGPASAAAPAPVWTVTRSTYHEGPLVQEWRWLADSSGIAFMERGPGGAGRLVLANLAKKTVTPLTPEGQTVKAFDLRDGSHYVYVLAASAELLKKAQAEREAAAVVVTGRSTQDIFFPVDLYPGQANRLDRGELWAVVDGKRTQIADPATGQPLVMFDEGEHNLVLSPNGRYLLTMVAVPEVPAAWVSRYPPPFPASPNRLRAGRQDLTVFRGSRLVSRPVRIDLQTGAISKLTDAPTSTATGWWAGGTPQWSRDSQAIVLPGAYDDSGAAGSRPCVLFVGPPGVHSCVEPHKARLASGYEEGYRAIEGVEFQDGDRNRIRVSFYNLDGSRGATNYRRGPDRNWSVAQQLAGEPPAAAADLEVTVRQDLNDPPVLVATDSKTKASRTLWDPNPQLEAIAIGEATVYRWKDSAGRNWKGGLFKPVDFKSGQRYPLVIQTHGFTEHQFKPSGIFPTATAARALAAAGIVVLQVGEEACPRTTPEEGPCAAGGYAAAAQQLAAEGLIDPKRVGLIGFSRTCYYVMEALTTHALDVKAASITDGVMGDYLQYLRTVDLSGNAVANDANALIGVPPFGDGLQQWLKRSPLFNIHKVEAALLVVGEGRSSLQFMWGPYAAMRFLNKPVELVLLNSDEHVLTNPAVRLASQGGSVDWFSFWLQDYEDPSAAKAAQYARWRELRQLQR